MKNIDPTQVDEIWKIIDRLLAQIVELNRTKIKEKEKESAKNDG